MMNTLQLSPGIEDPNSPGKGKQPVRRRDSASAGASDLSDVPVTPPPRHDSASAGPPARYGPGSAMSPVASYLHRKPASAGASNLSNVPETPPPHKVPPPSRPKKGVAFVVKKSKAVRDPPKERIKTYDDVEEEEEEDEGPVLPKRRRKNAKKVTFAGPPVAGSPASSSPKIVETPEASRPPYILTITRSGDKLLAVDNNGSKLVFDELRLNLR